MKSSEKKDSIIKIRDGSLKKNLKKRKKNHNRKKKKNASSLR